MSTKKMIFGMGVKLNPKRSHDKKKPLLYACISFMIKGNCWFFIFYA